MRYTSPTIGCFIYSNDYVKFISNLKYYLSIECKELKFENSKHKNLLDKSTILGHIDDIEIVFLHYGNTKDALDKWNRRRKRVNLSNLIIKYSDQNCFEKNDYEKFKKLNLKNKIFITGDESFAGDEDVIYLEQFKDIGFAKDDIKPSLKKIHIVKMLNKIKKGD
jgi:uncharacterized protein (DUF1919 family)